VAQHHCRDRREIGWAAGCGFDDRCQLAEVTGAEDAGVTIASAVAERRPDPDDLRSKGIVLTPRGASIIPVIREAVGEVETAWTQQLGSKRFAQLRSLLLDLNQQT
jgi:DNA-binding MarR family transcriptional regulator